MAEALLNWIDAEHFEAASAGTICGRVHRLSAEVLKEIGFDLGRKTPRSVHQVPDEEFDYVITLGERAPSSGRNFPRAEVVDWKFDDPAKGDDQEKQLCEFRIVRDQ